MPAPTFETADRSAPAPLVIVLLLTLLLGIQPLTTDLYLPTLPSLQRDLGASVAATQLTLSALVIAFGFAQLVAGPLSDRFGRRPVLLVGIALYGLASIGGAAAMTIEGLIGWRIAQGIAMAAAVTCGRSIVRDLFEPHAGAGVMARALGGLGVIAIVSPLVGGAIAQWGNWHLALLVPALFAAATLALVALRFDETLRRPDPTATQLRPLLRNWIEVLSDRTFRAWAAVSSLTFGGLFVILGASSFVYIGVLGLSRIGYGLLMAGNSVAYLAGTVTCRRWLVRHGLLGAARRGAWFSLIGGLGMAGVSIAGWHSVWALFAPQCLFAFGHGVHQPCSQVGALAPFPDKAGTAASLSGFLMMATAFGVSLWLGERLDGTVYPLSFGVAAFGIALALVAWTWVQRDGDPPARPPGDRRRSG